jgi:hypothetical protein
LIKFLLSKAEDVLKAAKEQELSTRLRSSRELCQGTLPSDISFPRTGHVEHEMKRFLLSLAALLFSSLAYAQGTGVAPNPQSPASSGTEGDSLLLIVIAVAVVIVAVGVYLFIKQSRRGRT